MLWMSGVLPTDGALNDNVTWMLTPLSLRSPCVCPPDVVHIVKCSQSQALPFFTALPLPCITLNANRRAQKKKKKKTREAWEWGYSRRKSSVLYRWLNLQSWPQLQQLPASHLSLWPFFVSFSYSATRSTRLLFLLLLTCNVPWFTWVDKRLTTVNACTSLTNGGQTTANRWWGGGRGREGGREGGWVAGLVCGWEGGRVGGWECGREGEGEREEGR